MTYHWIKGDAYTDKARFIDTLKGGTKYKTYFKSHYLRRSQRLVI